MKTMKKVMGMVLTLVLLLQSVPMSVQATEISMSAEEERLGMIYGELKVQGICEADPVKYRAAKDANGTVYIHMEDFAKLANGYFSEYTVKGSYRYVLDCWAITIYTQEDKVEVRYDITYNA